MPLILPTPPVHVRESLDAFITSQPAMRAMSRRSGLMAIEDTGRSPGVLLRYPHVFLNVYDPNDKRNLEPYAWQFIYGDRQQAVSLEVSAGTSGSDKDVTLVNGGRLQQTIQAVLETIRQRDGEDTPATLKVLHIRPLAFIGILLQRKTYEESTVIPLPPIPKQLAVRSEWPLNEFIEVVRPLVPVPTR